jgi:prepilin-type N-terminal cleavage/methylation domain-containing protein
MFKFMKSKKGFTLVELMIVVVIMAILVAVAVPIFSAVTKNARIKTCAANRREIISQVNGYLMGNVDGKQHTEAGSFKITSDGSAGELEGAAIGSGEKATSAEEKIYKSLFQEVPYCPVEGAIYSVEIKAANPSDPDQETTATVIVTCDRHPADGTETAAD